MSLMRTLRTTACVLAAALPAMAQAWPQKSIRLVVSFPPGGVHDTLARVLSPKLTEALGQPIVIENRPGAGGNIAAEAVARAAPDGYTFLVGSEALATNQALYRKLAYDVNRDLVAVTRLADFPVAFISHPSLAASNVADFVMLARAKPGQLLYGSAGIGTAGHLAGELFKSIADIDIVHVPYKGGAPALQDLVAGRIQAMFISVSLSAPQVRQGKLKALAVAGHRRAQQLAEVPTTAEAGYPAFEALLFSCLFAPAGTPEALINRMSAEFGKVLRSPDVRQRLGELGAVPAPNTPAEFAREMRETAERWGNLIRKKNIQAD